MEITQEWIVQFNKKCAEFLEAKKADDGNYVFPMNLDKNWLGDIHQIYNMKFHSDWNWIMEVVEKIQYYRACILSKNHCEIHMMPTDSITSINIGAKSTQLATIQSIDQFIDWYNKQKES